MKKLLLIFGVLIAGSPFVSCKKMKDDIKDLQNQANELAKQTDTLKAKHSSLKDQLDGIANAIGSDEPITATTTFEDNNGATRTVSATYNFKSTDYYTQYMINNGDGTYSIYIERFIDVDWNEGISVYFTYNPTTKAVTNESVGHYWDDNDPFYDYAYYYSGSYTGLTKSLTVDSFNLATGAISIKFSASGTSAYTASADVPNPGKPVSTNFAFAGKVKLFSQD
jgi:hypothetical protein